MKPNIHPQLHVVKVHCSCGNEWETTATVKELRLELCGQCHPFFTGKKRNIDAAGRVQRFEQRYAKPAEAPSKRKVAAKTARVAKAAKSVQPVLAKPKKPKAPKADAAAKTDAPAKEAVDKK